MTLLKDYLARRSGTVDAPRGLTGGGIPCGMRGEPFSRLARVAGARRGTRRGAGCAGHHVDESLGTTSDGGSWVADVPSPWNGTRAAVQPRLRAAAARRRSRPGDQAGSPRPRATPWWAPDTTPTARWWALGSASTRPVRGARRRSRHPPRRSPREVIAFGTSMGGLISALESERGNGRIDGSLTTCGLVAGSHPPQQLPAGRRVRARPSSWRGRCRSSSCASPARTRAWPPASSSRRSPQQAQSDARRPRAPGAGDGLHERANLGARPARCRPPTTTPPRSSSSSTSISAVRSRHDGLRRVGAAVDRAGRGRQRVVDGGRRLRAPARPIALRARRCVALHRQAGLDLRCGPRRARRAGANIRADAPAIRWLAQTSVPSGRLQVPELNLHTTSDQLVPVQQESFYASTVRGAGADRLLRQAYVARQGHCNFTPAELVAGVLAIQHRVAIRPVGWRRHAPEPPGDRDRTWASATRPSVPFRPWPLTATTAPSRGAVRRDDGLWTRSARSKDPTRACRGDRSRGCLPVLLGAAGGLLGLAAERPDAQGRPRRVRASA